jgi:DNA helicase-2/ATP-dependent DNA helicase PcrA
MTTQTKDIHYFWKLLNFTPNQQQKKAILHTDGPLYLPAGPGSGKTRVLLWRTFNLIVFHNVKPENIFLSTFTHKAANQLKEGLLTLLTYATEELNKPFEINNMYIGTIHSLCQKLLQDRRLSSKRNRNRPPVVLDELSQFFYLYQGKGFKDVLFPEIENEKPQDLWLKINTFFDKQSSSKFNAVSSLLSTFNRISEESPVLEKWEAKLNSEKKDEYKTFLWLLNLYRKYKASLKDSPVRTDLSLLQQDAYNYLQSCDRAGEVFEHIIIDEYQDTNTVQEYIVFTLAKENKNICVVGDDDQALYRFRGATVENFVNFPERVNHYLGTQPHTIPLITNYRSQKDIVHHYSTFMNLADWSAPDGSAYRVEKDIQAHNQSQAKTVFKTSNDTIEEVADEIASTVKSLLENNVVENANQIAFLFSSLQSKAVTEMKDALERIGIKTYAPRAGSFLYTVEAQQIYGMISLILGEYKPRFDKGSIKDFKKWHEKSRTAAAEIVQSDPLAQAFIKQKQDELEASKNDYKRLAGYAEDHKITLDTPATTDILRNLASLTGLSDSCKKTLNGKAFFDSLQKSIDTKNPFPVRYLISASTALDWTVLDLFYRFCGLSHFKQMIDNSAQNEAPLYNLSLVGQYISKFTEEFKSMITAFDLQEKRIVNSFFGSYLYTLFKRQEKEFENEEDPFPKDHVPFLTIHQSKGLEFPVVILGNFYKRNRIPILDERFSLLLEKKEPIELQPEFDAMRRFYVGMSRAEKLLIINNAKRYCSQDFKPYIEKIPELSSLDISTIEKSILKAEELPKSYSFTGDFNFYKQCPMQYQIFRKFAFPPSRSQTMAFGALVHQTIEDLHEYLIAKKKEA